MGVPYFNALSGGEHLPVSPILWLYIFLAESIGISSSTFTQCAIKLPNSAK